MKYIMIIQTAPDKAEIKKRYLDQLPINNC